MKKPPSITEMVAALKDAGWKQEHPTIWKTPDGRLYRGPALAYHVMAGLLWPPTTGGGGRVAEINHEN